MAIDDKARRPWLWYPGPIDSPLLEQQQNGGVISWNNLHIPAFVSRLKTMLLEVVAQRYILGTTHLGRRKLLVCQVLGTANMCTRSHDEQDTATRSTINNAQGL